MRAMQNEGARAGAADLHVPVPRADRPVPAEDRADVRRPRPHDRHARGEEDPQGDGGAAAVRQPAPETPQPYQATRTRLTRTSLCGNGPRTTPWHHPERGSMAIPNPVYDLGTNGVESGERPVHNWGPRVDNSRASANHPRARRAVHRSDTRFMHRATLATTCADERCPHNPQGLLLLLFFSLLFINKQKTGDASQRATKRPRTAETTEPRVPRSAGKPYGDGLRRELFRGGPRPLAARCCLWNGQP